MRLHSFVGRSQRRRRPLRTALHRARGGVRPCLDGSGHQTGRDAPQLLGAAPTLRTRSGRLSGVPARADDSLPPHALHRRHDDPHRPHGHAVLCRNLHERPQILRPGREVRLRHSFGDDAGRSARRRTALSRKVRHPARTALAGDARSHERLRRLRQRHRTDAARRGGTHLRPHRSLRRRPAPAGGWNHAPAQRLRSALQGTGRRNRPGETAREKFLRHGARRPMPDEFPWR